MKKIAVLLIMGAMAGQISAAEPVVTGKAAGELATVNALGLTNLATIGVVAGVTALAVVAADNGGSSTSTTTTTATNNK